MRPSKNTPKSQPNPTDMEKYDLINYPRIGIDLTGDVVGDTFPEALKEYDQWLAPKGQDAKDPRSYPAWSDAGVGGSWNQPEGWGSYGEVRKFVDEMREYDIHLPGMNFVTQRETDPYNDDPDPFIEIDGDDVRCPETGEVHPVAVEVLERILIEPGFVEASTSGGGIHMWPRGRLPEGVSKINLIIDTEPWGENDSPPVIELDTKTQTMLTGDWISSTPVDQSGKIDQSALEAAIVQYGKVDKNVEIVTGQRQPRDRTMDPSEVEPRKTRAELAKVDTTTDMEDIFDAVHQLRVHDLRIRAVKNGEEPSGWGLYDPAGYRSSDSGTSLHLSPDETTFFDQQLKETWGVLDQFAFEEGIISKPYHDLRGADFMKAVDAAREAGAPIPELEESDDRSRLVAGGPSLRMINLDHTDRRRYAKRRGVEWPTVDRVRELLNQEIHDSMEEQDKAVVRSPTGSGKTYAASTTPWRMYPEATGEQPVVHALDTREARDQAAQMAEEAGTDYKVLKGRGELCVMAAGDYDSKYTIEGYKPSEWFKLRCDQQGIPFSVAHQWAQEEIDLMPCCDDSTCPATTQFENIPRGDNGQPTHDQIICTHQFLMVPSLRFQTNVIIDEKPSFTTDMTPEQARTAVNEYLDWSPLPFDNIKDLELAAKEGAIETGQTAMTEGGLRSIYKGLKDDDVVEEIISSAQPGDLVRAVDQQTLANYHYGRDEAPDADGLTWGEVEEMIEEAADWHVRKAIKPNKLIDQMLDLQPSLSWYRNDHRRHALAPALARAVWGAQEHAGGNYFARVRYEPPRFDSDAEGESGWNTVFIDVTFNTNRDFATIDQTPAFTTTRSVVGLDAHAAESDPRWRISCGESIRTRRILDVEEEVLYRRFERGLFVVQVGDRTQPVTSGNYLDSGQGRRMDAIAEKITGVHGHLDAGITSIRAEKRLREAMEKAGSSDPQTMHYGEVESRGDFGGEDVGLVFGAHDPGDIPVMLDAAKLGLSGSPEMDDCPVCDGEGTDEGKPCEKCNGSGSVRAFGRRFVGRDGGEIEKILDSYRQGAIAQSVGRWARDAADPDDSAVVYVATDAIPDELVDAVAPGCEWLPSEDQARRYNWLTEEANGGTAKDIADEFGVDKSTACRDVDLWREKGLIQRVSVSGPNGAHVYTPTPHNDQLADVDLSDLPEAVASDVYASCTWDATIHAGLEPDVGSDGEITPSHDPQTSLDSWDDGITLPSD